MSKIYGESPSPVGEFIIPVEEFLMYQYLPISMGDPTDIRLPFRLAMFRPLVEKVVELENTRGKFIYLTVKNRYVKPGNWINREGWHTDGFGTEDINYIWCNNFPTIFNSTTLEGISEDCDTAITQFNTLVDERNNFTYPKNTFLRLSPYVLHRVDQDIFDLQMRCFVKVSVSKHQYNLRGNSHNYLFEYKWKMFDRAEIRNHPTKSESDFVKY